MDKLDRYQEELERRREATASTAAVGSASRADGKHFPPNYCAEDFPVTIIGCIRGRDGWYPAGFDHRKGTIVPLRQVQAPAPRKSAATQADDTTDNKNNQTTNQGERPTP